MADVAAFRREMEVLHRTYMQQLPGKVQQIQDLWMTLYQGVRVEETLDLLYHLIHKLNGSALTFGLSAMADRIEALEERLIHFREQGVPLTEQDKQQINKDLFILHRLAVDAGARASGEPGTLVLEEPAVSPAPAPAGTSAAPLLLLAEDESLLRQKLALSLRQAGFDVEEADNGLMALIHARKRRPDLILLDYVMPVMDGVETLQQIREDPGLQEVPVFMLTTPSKIDDVQRALSCDSDGYMTKPLDPVEVIDRVRTRLAHRAGAAVPPAPGRDEPRRRVLVADDCVVFRRQVSLILQEAGFDVEEADNGLMALTQARKERPDLILMDAMMPVMDGFEATSLFREDQALQDVPILMLTTSVRIKDVPKALQLGVDAYIAKPAVTEQVVEKVRACLGMA